MYIFLNYIFLDALTPKITLVFQNHDFDCIAMKMSYIFFSNYIFLDALTPKITLVFKNPEVMV